MYAGMPQAPGMGAPTDIGPDGMPMMPGPAGLPPGAQGELPPGADPGDEEGGFPPEDGEEDEGGPPGAGDEEGGDEDEESGPPPGVKKKSVRRMAAHDHPDNDMRRHLAEEHGFSWSRLQHEVTDPRRLHEADHQNRGKFSAHDRGIVFPPMTRLPEPAARAWPPHRIQRFDNPALDESYGGAADAANAVERSVNRGPDDYEDWRAAPPDHRRMSSRRTAHIPGDTPYIPDPEDRDLYEHMKDKHSWPGYLAPFEPDRMRQEHEWRHDPGAGPEPRGMNAHQHELPEGNSSDRWKPFVSGDGPFADRSGGSYTTPERAFQHVLDYEGGEDNRDDEEGASDSWFRPDPPEHRRMSSRSYRTVDGTELDERRYLRHLAVLHSGAAPAVLARIRREAASDDGFGWGDASEWHPVQEETHPIRSHLADAHWVPSRMTNATDVDTLRAIHERYHANNGSGHPRRPGREISSRRIASMGDDELAEHHARQKEGIESLRRAGFAQDPDWWFVDPLETGHRMAYTLGTRETEQGEVPGRWSVEIHHPGDPEGSIVRADLGDQHHLVGERLTQELRHPEMVKALAAQYQRASAAGDPRGEGEGSHHYPPSYSHRFRHFGRYEGSSDKEPGYALSYRDHTGMLRGMRARMKDEGFPVAGPEDARDMWPHPSFSLETGHQVGVTLDRRSGAWGMVVSHPRDLGEGRTMIDVDFGPNGQHVPRLVRRELGCPHVGREMMAQLERGRAWRPGDTYAGPANIVEHEAEGNGPRTAARSGYTEADDDGYEWPVSHDEWGDEAADESSPPRCTTCAHEGFAMDPPPYEHHWPDEGHDERVQGRMDARKAQEDRWDRGEYDASKYCGPACEEGHHEDLAHGVGSHHTFAEGEPEHEDARPMHYDPDLGFSPFEEPARSSGRYEYRDPSAEGRCHYCRRKLPPHRKLSARSTDEPREVSLRRSAAADYIPDSAHPEHEDRLRRHLDSMFRRNPGVDNVWHTETGHHILTVFAPNTAPDSAAMLIRHESGRGKPSHTVPLGHDPSRWADEAERHLRTPQLMKVMGDQMRGDWSSTRWKGPEGTWKESSLRRRAAPDYISDPSHPEQAFRRKLAETFKPVSAGRFTMETGHVLTPILHHNGTMEMRVWHPNSDAKDPRGRLGLSLGDDPSAWHGRLQDWLRSPGVMKDMGTIMQGKRIGHEGRRAA